MVSWLLSQIVTQVFPFFEIPNWAVPSVVLLLILGFPVALVLSWAFEITPEGIKRAKNVLPNESIARQTGRKLTALVGVLAAVAVGMMVFRLVRSQQASDAAKQTMPAAPGRMIESKSIAVLPLKI